jgi:hypothetical protein
VAAPLRIGVVGSGRTSPRLDALAEAAGREVARRGAVLVNGGGGGVMAASARGAAAAGGLTVGLLQGDDPGEGNPWLTLPLPTGMGQGRNVLVVRAAEAVVVVGGEWGTLSEVALAHKLRTPVVVLCPPDVGSLDLPIRSHPEDAVARALELARTCREIPHG